MCTVTYMPTSNGFLFASNRDEQPTRKTILPSLYKESDVHLFYPKDAVAGGTWIGVAKHKRLVCLLNGGFVYHDPKVKFNKSRGLVVKTMLITKNLKDTLNNLDLNGVAPFTLVVVDWEDELCIYELVWCKGVKYVKILNVEDAHIWSSSTLYTDEIKQERKQWFADEVLSKSTITKKTILNFHQNKSWGNMATSPKMKREKVETISTTLIVKEDECLTLEYADYIKEKNYSFVNFFKSVNV